MMSRFLLFLALALLLAGPAQARIMEELEEEIRLLGGRPMDAIHGACRGEPGLPPPPEGDLSAALLGIEASHALAREGQALLGAMRSTAERREALRLRCGAELDAWRLSREHPGTSADAGRQRPDGVVACLPGVEAVQERVAEEAARCMQLVRAARSHAAGETPLFPLGLSASQTRAQLASALLCDDDEFCLMPAREVSGRDLGWLGEGEPASVMLRFASDQRLATVAALYPQPSCQQSLLQVRGWREHLEAITEESRAVVLERPGFGSICGETELILWRGDYAIHLQAAESEGLVYSSARIHFIPHQNFEEPPEERHSGGL